jgi:hypothetical protein
MEAPKRNKSVWDAQSHGGHGVAFEELKKHDHILGLPWITIEKVPLIFSGQLFAPTSVVKSYRNEDASLFSVVGGLKVIQI